MWEGFTMEVLQRPGGELATRPIDMYETEEGCLSLDGYTVNS